MFSVSFIIYPLSIACAANNFQELTMSELPSLSVMKDSELLTNALEEFEGKLNEFFYVVPNSKLWDQRPKKTFAANKLTLGEFGKNEEKAHFLKCNEYEDIKRDDVCDEVKKYIQSLRENTFRNDDSSSLISVLSDCESKITMNLATLVNGSIKNEADLRFVAGNPIVCMICNYWRHKVRVCCVS